MARPHRPATDGQRLELVAAAEALAGALDRYREALEPVAGELADPRAITDAAKLWADLFAVQVESWKHHRAAKAAG